jgi:tetratricopeptide (TPR) repeat protein
MLNDRNIVGAGFGWNIFRVVQTRPLTFLTFHWNYLAGGNDPAGWHWVNLLLHSANAVLLLLIARRHASSGTAFIAASLFALHPLQTEAVTYIYQRATVLATLFALLSFLLFLRKQYAWSAGAFGLSLLAKEETIALPLLLLLYDVVYRRRRPCMGYYSGMLGLAGLAAGRLFYVLHVIPNPTVGYRLRGIPAPSYALSEPRVLWLYLRLFVFPVDLNVDHDVALSRGLFSPPSTWFALLGLLALVGVLAYLAWCRKEPAFWGLGFFVLLAPSSSLVPALDLMFEHRVYFPLMCLVIASAGLLARLPQRIMTSGVIVLLIALLTATLARNRVWHDEESLWTDAMRKSPHKARPYAALGRALVTEDPGQARQLLEHAATLDPNDPSIHNDLGVALLFNTDASGALQHFQRAIAQAGETTDYLTNLGMAFRALGQPDQAIRSFRRALELDPCAGAAREDLARALVYQGNKLEAFVATQVPANCHLPPEEVQKLEEVRNSIR